MTKDAVGDDIFGAAADMLANNRQEEALEQADRGLAANPGSYSGVMLRSQILSELGRFDEGIAGLRQSLDRLYLEIGSGDATDDQRVDATLLNKWLGIVYWEAARVGADQRQWQHAADAFMTALQFDVSNAYAWNGLGAAQLQLGRSDEAIMAFRQAIALAPNFSEPRLGLERASEAGPDDLFGRAHHLRHDGKLLDALAAVDRAIHLYPDSYWGHFTRALLLGDLGRLEESRTENLRAVELVLPFRLDHSPNPANKTCLADLYEYTGEVHGRLAMAEQSEVRRKQLWVDALANYQMAIDLEESRADSWFGKGVALSKLGRRREALVALKRTLELDPNYLDAYEYLLEAEFKLLSLVAVFRTFRAYISIIRSGVGHR